MAEINVDKEGEKTIEETSTSSTDQVETSGSSNKDKYPELFYSHGMDCRKYQGEKMRGTIKTIPEDFIVTEIDSNGELVTLDKDCPILDPPDIKQLPLSPIPQDDDDDDYDSSNVLTERQLSDIRDLSRRFEEHIDTNTSTHFSEIVDLGCYDNKRVRTLMHEVIQNNFPLLKSRTTHNKENICQLFVYPDPSYPKLLPLLGKEESIKLLHFSKSSDPLANETHYLPPDPSREHRAQVHCLIDKLFGTFLQTDTINIVTKKKKTKKRTYDEMISSGTDQSTSSNNSITSTASTSNSFSSDTSSSSSSVFSSDACSTPSYAIAVSYKRRVIYNAKKRKEGHSVKHTPSYYTRFTLKKDNIESFEAILKMSESLNVEPGQLCYSGSKDKKAITYQQMTAKNVSMRRLLSISIPGLELGSFEYIPRQIGFGDHNSNHFQIRVRSLKTEKKGQSILEEIVKVGMQSLEENGFVNYYGMQRFGNFYEDDPAITPLIGYFMIRNDPENAVKAMFKPVGRDKWQSVTAKKYFTRTGDIKGTIPLMPEALSREMLTLKSLNRFGMSKINNYGFTVDHALVVTNLHDDSLSLYGCDKTLLTFPHQARQLYIHSFTSLMWNHLASFRIQEYGNEPVEGDLVYVNQSNMGDAVRPITSSDISSCQYTMKDIVLPVTGYKSMLPENRVGDKLKEILAGLGLTLLSFRSCRYSYCSGTYRKLISYPYGLKWKMKMAPPLSMPLPTSSLETSPVAMDAATALTGNGDGVPVTIQEPNEPSIEMDFRLDPGSYVTTMLNEILIGNI